MKCLTPGCSRRAYGTLTRCGGCIDRMLFGPRLPAATVERLSTYILPPLARTARSSEAPRDGSPSADSGSVTASPGGRASLDPAARAT